MEQVAWNSPAKLVASRNRPIYSGSLAMCVLHFRDLSPFRRVTCHIALEKEAICGKTWLEPEEILTIMSGTNLPPELQSA